MADLVTEGRAAWHRYFYPTVDDFIDGETAELKPTVVMALADNLRLCLDALTARSAELAEAKAGCNQLQTQLDNVQNELDAAERLLQEKGYTVERKP